VVSIVGTDEVDLNRNHISWVSPLGRALMKSAAGNSESFNCRAVQNI
jgi:transcription elongation factor GreB